jgi:NADH-quinone oxidoreductase subunit L
MHAPVKDTAGIAQSLWLIIALPLLGAFICGVFGRSLGRANVHLVAVGAVAGSFLLSLLAFWTVNDQNTVFVSKHLPKVDANLFHYALGYDYGTWFKVGDFQVRFGLWVDHLSGILLLVITGVGLLIHIYSTSYMEHDAAYWRYFAYLNLFVANMLVLVLGDNLVLTFVGWEGVGLCSYLLIGFWYTDPAKAWAGRKAFVTNRIGDFAFLIGAFLLVSLISDFSKSSNMANFRTPMGPETWRAGVEATGQLSYQTLETFARFLPHKSVAGQYGMDTVITSGPLEGYAVGAVLTAILLLFMLGAAGKSAQLPLYVWLPDAMAGPTPVSALIHAATMVTAGVYLFCRISYLLVFSPTAMAVVAIVGALTALLAALIAFAQDDIKKVLAYSTVSQLGIMFMGVGMGIFWAAVLHLVTHAFFKACLFLGAGSVMHGNADETDIKKLGGLRKEMRWTWATFAIATLAITGIVPLSGFFSKDAILHGIHLTKFPEGLSWVPTFVWGLGLLVAMCTAFYMTRLYILTFEGKRASDAKIAHAHESAPPMTLALTVLAVLSVVASVYAWPLMGHGEHKEPVMENFLSPVFATTRAVVRTNLGLPNHPLVATEHGGMLMAYLQAWIIALVGGGAAAFLYLRFFPSRAGQPTPSFARGLRTVAQRKFYVDELYELLVIKPIKGASFFFYKVVDGLVIDTLAVRGTAWVTYRAGSLLRYFQTGDVQSYAAVMVLAVLCGVAYAFFALK